MSRNLQNFAALPPQGYGYMTDLQRLDHKVRCACLDALRAGAGTWNVGEVLRQVAGDVARLSQPKSTEDVDA